MFKRIIFEDWVAISKITSFIVAACIFLIAVIRALRVPKEKREYLANLPLDGSESPPAPPQAPTSSPRKP